MEHKKAQLEISFGTIFSVLLIIAFIAFAFFGIKKFLEVQDEIIAKKMIDDLNFDIDKMWKSSRGSQEVNYLLSKDTEMVCFWEKDAEYEDDPNNIYFLSQEEDISGKLEHLDLEKTLDGKDKLCVPVSNRRVTFFISKDYGETLVKISREEVIESTN